MDNLSDAARPAIDSWDKVDASKGWARAAGGEERNKQLVQNIKDMERFVETVSFAYTLVQQYGEDLKYRWKVSTASLALKRLVRNLSLFFFSLESPHLWQNNYNVDGNLQRK